MKPSLKREIAGIVILIGMGFFSLTPEDILLGIVGAILFLLGLNFFIDAKIEESKTDVEERKTDEKVEESKKEEAKQEEVKNE